LEFFIFRHGQTDWNAERRVQGHTDIDLNETGRREAELLGERLKDLNIQKIYSSDLSRAQETARISNPNLEIETSPRLREAHFGEAEGKIFTDVLKEFGDEYFRTEPVYWDHRIAGAETKRECIERVWGFMDEIAKKAEFETVGISSHGGVIRNIVHSLMPPETPKIEIPNCCIYQISNINLEWKLVGQL